MVSLLLVVFAVQLTIHLINTVGAGAINSLAWYLFSKLPTPISNKAREPVRLRDEVVRLKRELKATSAQDEFSKWAKLRRQHDKVLGEHEKVSKELGAFKSQFDTAVKVLRWLGTTGLRFGLQTWFQKQPMFWVPKGWIPYYAEWLLSFPRAPVGAVSIQVWTSACGAVIALVSAAVASVVALILKSGNGQKRAQPMKMKADSASAASADIKKEL